MNEMNFISFNVCISCFVQKRKLNIYIGIKWTKREKKKMENKAAAAKEEKKLLSHSAFISIRNGK